MKFAIPHQATYPLLGMTLFLLPSGPLGAQETDFQLRVEAPASVTSGSEFDVTLRGSSDLDLLGYAAHLTYDPELLSVVPSSTQERFAGTVWEEADFMSTTDDPAAGALVIGAILETDDAGPRVVSAGGDLEFLRLGFRAIEVESAQSTAIGFSDDIDGTLLADADLGGHDAGNDLTLIPGAVDIVLPGVMFVRGDCNGDGSVSGEVNDAVFLLQFNFAGGTEPPCLAACDANGDGNADVSDAVYVLLFNFAGGEAPVTPFPECGPTVLPTDEVLGCANSTGGCP